MLANIAPDLQFRERVANNLVSLTVLKNAFARMSRFNPSQQEIQDHTAQITQKRIVNLRSASLFLHELVYCF